MPDLATVHQLQFSVEVIGQGKGRQYTVRVEAGDDVPESVAMPIVNMMSTAPLFFPLLESMLGNWKRMHEGDNVPAQFHAQLSAQFREVERAFARLQKEATRG